MPEQQAPQETTLNCAGCGKPIKKIKRYYRNGKFYCTRKCFERKAKAQVKAEE